jgi:hypothetical protein
MNNDFNLEPEVMATVTFTGEELRCLRLNKPGKSTLLGGYQRMENWILKNTDAQTGKCLFTPDKLERIKRYCARYGPGGPNERLRKACEPALRRAKLL